MEAPHDVALVARANKPPEVNEKLDAVKEPLAEAIRIDVGKLLTKQLRWRGSLGASPVVGAAALQEEQEPPPE
jgi:hypothetical protein